MDQATNTEAASRTCFSPHQLFPRGGSLNLKLRVRSGLPFIQDQGFVIITYLKLLFNLAWGL